MRAAGTFSGAAYRLVKYKVGATVVAGQPVLTDGTNKYGEVTDPTTTSLADCVGLTVNSATYSTTQGSEGVVEVIVNPDLIVAARANPGATSGTAFADGDGNFLTNETASAAGTTIVDATLATDDKWNGGTVFCLSGANAGESRVVTDVVAASTSLTVTVPFSNAIAVGDTFLVVPWSKQSTKLQLTSDFTEANAAIAAGTGANVRIIDVRVNTSSPYSPSSPLCEVLFCFADHYFNPESA